MPVAPLKLYVGENYREPKLTTHIALLFPFWGVAAKESAPFVRAAALQYQYSKDDFALVDRIEDADYVLMPYQYERLKKFNPERLAFIVRESQAAGKPLLIDAAGDLEYPIDIPNAVILRISQYRYSKKPNEIAIPFICEDLLESYAGGELKLRPKAAKPSVAFMGWAQLPLKKKATTFAKELPITLAALFDPERGAEHKGVFLRARALKTLGADSRIDPHFTVRATYSGNAATIGADPAARRKAFVENLIDADYALCVRGDGNNSVRFYEALSLGRIPLFLDTACVLPLNDMIDYTKFCLFVDWRDTARVGAILADFHSKLSTEQFLAMQRAARAAYRDHLRVDSFSHELARELRKRLT